MSVEDDYETIARSMVATAVVRFIEDSPWEEYPDIGQFDFERILRRARDIARFDISVKEWGGAYGRLAARANKEVSELP